MYCKRCQKILSGKQISYCSLRCSKLHLKSLYRKRKKDQINQYKRITNKTGLRISGYYEITIKPKHLLLQPKCQKCGTETDIQVCHVKPRNIGGGHSSLITLCRKHHYYFDKALKDFWYQE